MYFNPYSDRFDVVCNEEYGFIYTYQSVIGICASQRIRFPLSNKTQCILRRRGRLTRGQFSTHKLHCSASLSALSIRASKHFEQKAISYPHVAYKKTLRIPPHTAVAHMDG